MKSVIVHLIRNILIIISFRSKCKIGLKYALYKKFQKIVFLVYQSLSCHSAEQKVCKRGAAITSTPRHLAPGITAVIRANQIKWSPSHGATEGEWGVRDAGRASLKRIVAY